MEEENKKINNIDVENLLQSSYEIDNQSFDDSEDNASNSKITLQLSYPTSDMENVKIILDFIQAIKDNNISHVKEILEEDEFNKKILFEESYEGILPIQYAILFGNFKVAEILLEYGASFDCLLEGMPLLHLSLSFAIFSHYRKKSIECFRFLIEKFKDQLINQRDRLGRTILHVIFQNDLWECLSDNKILVTIDDLFINDLNGDSVIDYIYIYNSRQSFYSIVNSQCSCLDLFKEIIKINSGFIDKCVIFNSIGILDVLVDQANINNELKNLLVEDLTANLITIEEESESDENKKSSKKRILENYLKRLRCEDSEENKTIPNEYFSNDDCNKTLIVYNSKCTLHGDLTDDNPILRLKRRMSQVENPDRISVLFQPPFGILLSDFCLQRFTFRESPKPACLADILRVHDFNYIESILKFCNSLKEENRTKCYKYDSDTYINKHSWDSAIYAAGCVIDAVDQIMNKENGSNKHTNAFCLIRPPGHHAGYFGRVESPNINCHSSNGFCFLNNVAIGAAYSIYRYQDEIKKVAIVDFDVHHGNGTQEIIQFLSKTNQTVKSENKFGNVTISQTICKPWRDFNDAENVLFISTHAYDEEAPGKFYPSSGTLEENNDKDSVIYPGGILNVPIHGDKKLSYGYRNLFRSKIIPRLIKFKPDLIFVSAGFDGHANEHINSSYMKLTEYDYRWITEELMKIANRFSKGRLISVLEGGYNINNGVVSSFAQSVLYHAKFLNICANKNKEKCLILSKVRRKREYLRDLDNYKTFKKQKNEVNSENLIKYEDEVNVRENRYSFRSEKIQEVDNNNLENIKNQKVGYEFNKQEMNLKLLNKNQEIIEMNKINADMNINVDELDVDYMKVIENDYDKNYNPFRINNFGVHEKESESEKEDELIKIKTEEFPKNIFEEVNPNRQDEYNYFISEELKNVDVKQEFYVFNKPHDKNYSDIPKEIENNNLNNNYENHDMMYEEIEVEMDEDEPIA